MKKFFVLLVVALVSGCAGLQSAYRPSDVTGGYGEEKLSDDAYIVFFDANGFTPPEITKKYVQRRAAQLTLKDGFDCFVMSDEKQTQSYYYSTTNKLAAKSRHYAASENAAAFGANKPDNNSLSAVVQLFKQSTAPTGCMNATQTLELTNI